MVEKVIWHAGTTKTGSTAIQQFLAKNRESFEEQGFFVPSFRKATHKYLLSKDLTSLFSNAQFRRKAVRQARNEMLSWNLEGKRAAIISFEGQFLSEEARPHPQALSRKLGARAAIHEYVVWVRDPLSWASSVLLQDLKKGRFRCGPRYLDLSKALLSFHSRLSVAPQRISIEFRKYASRERNDGGAVSDFLRFAGLELTQEMVIPDINVNPSISPEAGLLVATEGENFNEFE